MCVVRFFPPPPEPPPHHHAARQPTGRATKSNPAIARQYQQQFCLAYGAFGPQQQQQACFLTEQHDLKFHKLRAVLSLLPPIQRLDIITVAGSRRFHSVQHRSRSRSLPAPPGGRGLLVGPQSGLVHFYVGGVSGTVGVAPAFCSIQPPLCLWHRRRVCLPAPDLLGHQPAFPVASSMNKVGRLSSVECRKRQKSAPAGNSSSRHTSHVICHTP